MSLTWESFRRLTTEQDKLRSLINSTKSQDEDPMSTIEHRLAEVRLMAKPRKDERHVLERMPPDRKQLILKVDQTPIEELREQRRKGFQRPFDRIRWASKMISLLFRAIDPRKRYYMESSEQGLQPKVEQLSSDDGINQSDNKTSIGLDLQAALTTQPHMRDRKSLKKILWILRASRAFKHLFPAEMEMEVARHVAYEKYDDGRIICKQGCPADRFYYVIAGRIAILREYNLTTGKVTKNMGYLIKGMTSDAEELDKGWLREDSLVARGQVEVLLLDKEVFQFLQHTTQGPPVEFLQSVDLFEEFPVQGFFTNPEAIEYKYYGQGKIVAKDTNRTPWLHVIKSGHVKVVRRQSVVDALSSNEAKFTGTRVEDLGMGKSFSHAKSMLGIQANQKKYKDIMKTAKPLQISESPNDTVSNPLGNTIGSNVQVQNDRPLEEEVSIDDVTDVSSVADEHTVPSGDYEDTQSVEGCVDIKEGKQKAKTKKNVRMNSFLPTLNIPMRGDGESQSDYEPHSMWLTRERTTHSEMMKPGDAPIQQKEPSRRPAFIQVDLLRPGDVHGLDNLQGSSPMNSSGLTLLSDGAEVIKINKRFFLNNAGNNTMLKVDTMYKDYISEDEARKLLYERETWLQYKSALWNRMTSTISLPAITR